MPDNGTRTPSARRRMPDTTPLTANVEGVARAVQNLISLVLGLAAALTGGGFIVVNSHLSKFTDIHGYSVNPSQYLAAGVGLLIPPVLATAIVFGAYYTGRLLGVIRRRRETARPVEGPVEEPPERRALPKRLEAAFKGFESLAENRTFRRALVISGFGLYTVLFGLFYGEYIYGSIPHYLGGGRPEPMIAVFDDEMTPALLGLTVDPVQPRRTQTLLLLAELSDGLLVLDTNTGRVAAIKNESLTGAMDDQIVEWAITPTPAAAPMPPVTPNP